MKTFIPLYTIPWAIKWTAISIQLLAATVTSSPQVRNAAILFAQQQLQYDYIAYLEALPTRWEVVQKY
jgi:hypothetical protein